MKKYYICNNWFNLIADKKINCRYTSYDYFIVIWNCWIDLLKAWYDNTRHLSSVIYKKQADAKRS